MNQTAKIIFLFLVFFQSAVFSFYSDLGIESAYDSNVFEDSNHQESFILSSFWSFRHASVQGESSVVFLEGNFFLDKYFSVKEEDNFSGNLKLKYRLKGEENTLDLTLGGFYDNLWNDSSRTFLKVFFNPEYRSDFDFMVFALGIDGGRYLFSKSDYDQYYASFSIKTEIAPSLSHKITLNLNFEKDFFTEKYIFNSSYQSTSEKIIRNKAGGSFTWDYYLSSFITFSLKAKLENYFSDGNDLFFGPSETTLILDGDEVIFKNYYNTLVSEGAFSIEWNPKDWKIIFSTGFTGENYDGRYPYDASGNPVLSEKLSILSFYLTLRLKYYFSESCYLNFSAAVQKNQSNDELYDALLKKISAGIGFLF
ncbi:MAG TPA: hypothetical protein DHW82_10415 [Spirochaetia bacterium]|nr:MAG: hypothetical protein A2Y41_00155 [Spirochaetes bacterium GWB1_36_13]HCL57405.1 hypothetical protein [Spirochaetia bacterium]